MLYLFKDMPVLGHGLPYINMKLRTARHRYGHRFFCICMQAEISNITSALAVTRNATGAATVSLSGNVPVTACRCSQQLRATWEQCSTEVAAGDACACIDVPCATSMTVTPATPDIGCPDDEASQSPISLPTSTALSVQLTYDDGRCAMT